MTAAGGRFTLARRLGAATAALSRATGRGGGTTIGGRVTLAVDPSALRHAAAGRRLALVSGTNGKTTTRTLLVAALRTAGPVVSNGGGANLPPGLTAALGADLDAQLDFEEGLQREAGRTDDYRECVHAFLEKRKPAFKGR